MPDSPKHVNLASFISKVNLFVNSCRQMYDASLRTNGELAALSADDLRAIREAAKNVSDLAKFFDKAPDDWPFGGLHDNAGKVVAQWPTDTSKPANFNAALQAMKDLFDQGKDSSIADVSGEGAAVGGGAGGGVIVTSPPPPPGKDKNDLETLFKNVSDSLLSAQKELNRNSLDYVANLDPNIPPAYYGIPSVKAEMHVGFREIKEKGINLILFSSMQQKQQFAESTVTFEVVGAPPPPGPTRFGEFVVPIPRLFVVGQKRDEILDKAVKPALGDQTIYQNGRAAAVVLRYEDEPPPVTSPPGERPPQRYLVLWPGFNVNNALPVWRNVAAAYVVEHVEGVYEIPTDTSVFPVPGNGVFQSAKQTVDALAKPISDPVNSSALPQTVKNQINAAARDLAGRVADFGEVVVNALYVVGSWIEAMKYKPPPR